MEELKIVGWTDFDSEYPTKVMNGDEMSAVLELLRKEILEKKYCFSGTTHQYSSTGVPVFSDGTCLRCSMRAWGLIMAQVYSDVHGINLSYLDFYTDTFGDMVVPTDDYPLVDPLEVEDTQLGIVIEEDDKVISEVLSSGMEFLTTDKVLRRYIVFLKEQGY